MSKLERKTNEAIATIFRAFPQALSALLSAYWRRRPYYGQSADIAGQRLQSAKKQNPGAVTADEVNLVASMNAERTERAGGADEDSDED
jgi:hypothetical protein